MERGTLYDQLRAEARSFSITLNSKGTNLSTQERSLSDETYVERNSLWTSTFALTIEPIQGRSRISVGSTTVTKDLLRAVI